jgi:hypothetical protein
MIGMAVGDEDGLIDDELDDCLPAEMPSKPHEVEVRLTSWHYFGQASL